MQKSAFSISQKKKTPRSRTSQEIQQEKLLKKELKLGRARSATSAETSTTDSGPRAYSIHPRSGKGGSASSSPSIVKNQRFPRISSVEDRVVGFSTSAKEPILVEDI